MKKFLCLVMCIVMVAGIAMFATACSSTSTEKPAAAEEKDEISHRGNALKALAEVLAKNS